MPYRYKSRRRRSQKPWYKKKYNAMEIAGKALSGVRHLKGLVNAEKMKIDAVESATINTTGGVYQLSPIPQGDTDGSRHGNSVYARSIFGRLGLVKALAADTTFVRFMIFIDNQQTADTTPTLTDVLESASVFAPLNNLTVGRYSIKYDKLISMSALHDATHRKIFIPLKHHIRYNGTASTDIQKGGIYALVISDQPTNVPSFTYNLRLNYYDN